MMPKMRSHLVPTGLRSNTLSICSGVGTGRGRVALAMRVSFSDRRKEYASEQYLRGLPGSAPPEEHRGYDLRRFRGRPRLPASTCLRSSRDLARQDLGDE